MTEVIEILKRDMRNKTKKETEAFIGKLNLMLCPYCLEPIPETLDCVNPACKRETNAIKTNKFNEYKANYFNRDYKCFECDSLLFSTNDIYVHTRLTGNNIHGMKMSNDELCCVKCHRVYQRTPFEIEALKRRIAEHDAKITKILEMVQTIIDSVETKKDAAD